MTISPYQVNSILKAYSKQSKIKLKDAVPSETVKNDKYKDVVSLTSKDDKTQAYDKISYSLLDIILKGKT
ncbi:MAG: hypothetical protein ACE14T_06000 [Syntrophales bacterium]